jgi:hypothetical protein
MEYNPSLQILKDIRDPHLLEKLLPPLLLKNFEGTGLSLLEIILYDPELYAKLPSVGPSKINQFREFQAQFLNSEFVQSFIQKAESHLIEQKLESCSFEEARDLEFEWDNEVELLELLHRSVLAFITELRNIQKMLSPGQSLKSLTKQLNYLELYYGINQNTMSFAEIGHQCGLTRQGVRISLYSLKEGQFNLSHFLKGQKHYFGLKVPKAFVSFIENCLQDNIYRALDYFSIQEFTELKVRNLLAPYEYTLLKQEDHEDQKVERYILIDENNSLYYQAHITLLNDVLRNGNPMSKEEIERAIPKELESRKQHHFNKPLLEKGVDKKILDILLSDSNKIEKISDEEGETLYRLTWPYLPSINAKATYVLFNAQKTISLEEISLQIDELNQSYNINEKNGDIKIHKAPYIEAIGKIGLWRYISNKSTNQRAQSYTEHLNEILKNKFIGKASYEEIIAAVDSDKFHGYGEPTTRAYLNTFARRAKSNPSLFIHEDFISVYPSIEVLPPKNKYFQNAAINEIVKTLQDKNKLSKSELNKIVLSALEEQGYRIRHKYVLNPILTQCEGYNIIEKDEEGDFCLVLSELDKIDLTKIGLKQEPEYRKQLRTEAIDYLKNIGQASFSDLKQKFLHLIPQNIDRNNFYRAFDSDSIFIKYYVDSVLYLKLNYNDPQLETFGLTGQKAPTTIDVKHGEIELKIFERPRFDIAKLKERIIELLEEKKEFGFEKEEAGIGFDAFQQILYKTTKLSTWAEVLLQNLYQVFMSGADQIDRYQCLNHLITSYETYIKRLIDKNQYVSGQYDVISKIKPLHELKYYKDLPSYHRVNRKKLKFSRTLNSLIFLSNKYRHDRDHESIDLPFKHDNDAILEYVGLYIITALLSKTK